MKEINKKKYMLVCFDVENEIYIFNSIDDMLKSFGVKTVDRLLEIQSDVFLDVCIYEVTKEWSL